MNRAEMLRVFHDQQGASSEVLCSLFWKVEAWSRIAVALAGRPGDELPAGLVVVRTAVVTEDGFEDAIAAAPVIPAQLAANGQGSRAHGVWLVPFYTPSRAVRFAVDVAAGLEADARAYQMVALTAAPDEELDDHAFTALVSRTDAAARRAIASDRADRFQKELS